MAVLLLALLGCLTGEIGDKGQLLLRALAGRYERDGAIIAGIIVAAAANAAIAACAGAWIAPMLGPDARLLFLALAIGFLGIGMVWPVRRVDTLDDWPTGPFLTAMLGLFILGFGDGPQFLLLGIVAHGAHPVLAGIGGAIGTIIALVPAVLLRDQLWTAVPLRLIRWTGAALLLVLAAILALQALRLP